MGVCSVKNLLRLSAATALLAYMTYTPYPADVDNRAFKTVLTTVFRVMVTIARAGEFLGYGCYMVTLRNMMSGLIKQTVDGRHVEVTADTMKGTDVLIFRPKEAAEGLRPGLVYLHGGGWALSNPEAYRDVCLKLAEETQAVVISVNYRKAPEHVFPAAIDDCIEVTKFVLTNAKQYGVNPDRIGIAGDSAGGNLAMATALHLAMNKDSTIPTLKFQGLIYPALQAFDLKLPSYTSYKDGPGLLSKRLMLDFYLFYLFGETSLFDAFSDNQHISPALKRSKYASYVSTDLLPENIRPQLTSSEKQDGNETLSKQIEEFLLNPKFAPLMVPDEQLALLPPTYLLIAELDVLRDDGFLAAARLKNAKVLVEVCYEKSEEHGFLSNMDFENARKAISKLSNFYKKNVSN